MVTLYVIYVSSGSTIFCGLSTVTWVSRRNVNFGRKSSSSAAAVVAFAGNDTSWNVKTAFFFQTIQSKSTSRVVLRTYRGRVVRRRCDVFLLLHGHLEYGRVAVGHHRSVAFGARLKKRIDSPVTVPRRRAGRRSVAIFAPNNPDAVAATFFAAKENSRYQRPTAGRCLHTIPDATLTAVALSALPPPMITPRP